MDHRLEARRLVAAIVLFSLALATLVVRYLPAHHIKHELGDPVEGIHAVGLFVPEADGAAVVHWSATDAHLRIPLADRRGAQQLALVLRTDELAAHSLALEVEGAALATSVTPAYRTYHVFAPATAARALNVGLHLPATATTAQSPRGVAIDQLVVVGRSGWPPLWDLLSLLALALVPALLLALANRLPFDWALVPGVLLLGLYLVLPAADRSGLFLFGPVAALLVAGVVLLPIARQHPTLVLLLFAGAALRSYALAWGSGYVFHPDEQALAQRASSEPIHQLSMWTARWVADLSGQAAWNEAWGLVLLGRVWSVLTGSALIVVVYLLGRRLLRARWALLATAYVAFAPMLIQQSHLATSIQFETLLVALLMLSATGTALFGRWRDSLACGLWSGAVLAFCPHGGIWLIAPVVAHLMTRRQSRNLPALATATALALVFGSLCSWAFGPVGVSAAASTVAAHTPTSAEIMAAASKFPALDAYVHALFNILLWGVGPLLMQLSIVGWGFGMVLSLPASRDRPWLPLLWATGAYFVVAAGDSTPAHSLTLVVPLLCLTAAFLLQSFAQRLFHPVGQRTVRLLAGTGLGLVLLTSVGLLNLYRMPDPRIAASRWLIAHVPPGTAVLHDLSMPDRLPLGLSRLYAAHALPGGSAQDHTPQHDAYRVALMQAQYLVLAVDRGDLWLDQRILHDPIAACYYQALFDGRLGFVPHVSFDAQPHIGSWTMNDTWVDPALRSFDHPQVRIFERVVTPAPEALDLMLRCGESQS
jgi:hypothetical protein